MSGDPAPQRRRARMGLNATWSMAVGGMVGGGIFSVLGVVVAQAGAWAWLSFVAAGAVALCTAWSYAALARRFEEGGGAFTYLRDIHHEGLAGSLSWILILGYVLTLSVYGFTFGSYLAEVTGGGPWMARLSALVLIAGLTVVNLLGVGEASRVEIVTVWGKVLVLVALAAVGLWQLRPERLGEGVADAGPLVALTAGASIFMAYEGFQLLTYDYEDIRDPRRTLPRATLLAVVSVIVLYVVVALGATSLVGAGTVVAQKEVALAAAGAAAFGAPGRIVVSLAAALSTASAINATLFATARLARRVAADRELPRFFSRENRRGMPDRAVIVLGLAGAVLAAVGRLGDMVEAASLAFLFTFAVVNAIAARRIERFRWVSVLGAVGASAALLALLVRLVRLNPVALAALGAFALIATIGRPLLLRRRSA